MKSSLSKALGELVWKKRSAIHNMQSKQMQTTETSISSTEEPCVVVNSIVDVGSPNDGKGFGEVKNDTTTVTTKTDETPSVKKMRKWPNDLTAMVGYNDIVEPIKKILEEGYRLIRKDKQDFEYEGYNIGKQERKFVPPPNYRFSKKFLEIEKKGNKSLFDVAIHTIFLLGIEQGRRFQKQDNKPIAKLVKAMEHYRKDNRRLRIQVDILNARIKFKTENPNMSDNELDALVKKEISSGRETRLELARKELGLDPLKSFKAKEVNKLVFSELVKMAKAVHKECTKAEWKDILKDNGWTNNEWLNRCKHKNVLITFSK